MRIRMMRRRPTRLPRVFMRRGRSFTRGHRALIKLLVVFVLIFALFAYSASRVRPVIAMLARSEAREFVIRAINNAIAEEIEDGNLDYHRLVSFERDQTGSINALVTNAALINILQTRISNNVVDNVENVVDANMAIPIGNAIGGMILLGRGPRVPVRIQSVTNVETRFTNAFSSEGINQTRHVIMLEILVEIDIIIPGDRESTIVTTEVAIAETVIVGTVPNVYADLGRLLG